MSTFIWNWRKSQRLLTTSRNVLHTNEIELALCHRGHRFPTIPPYQNRYHFHRKLCLRSSNHHRPQGHWIPARMISARRIKVSKENRTSLMSHSYHKSSTSRWITTIPSRSLILYKSTISRTVWVSPKVTSKVIDLPPSTRFLKVSSKDRWITAYRIVVDVSL